MKKVTKKLLVTLMIVALLFSNVLIFNTYAVATVNSNIVTTLSAVKEDGTEATALTGKIGIKINLQLLNSQEVSAVSLDLHYDPNVLTLAIDDYGDPEIGTSNTTKWGVDSANTAISGEVIITGSRNNRWGVEGEMYTVWFNVASGNTATSTTVSVDWNSDDWNPDGLIEYSLNGTDTYSSPASLTFPTITVVESTLTINANGGTYDGLATKTVTQNQDTTYVVDNTKITTSQTGYTVQFDDGNGVASSSVSPITQQKSFNGWTKTGGGSFNSSTNVYTFATTNGTLTANWQNDPITLPSASQIGKTFDGWYKSNGQKAGNANASYTPRANETLTARFTDVQYQLTVKPNGGTFTYNGNNYTNDVNIPGTYNQREELANPTGPAGYTVTFHTNYGTDVATPTATTTTFTGWTKSGKGNLADNTAGTAKVYIFGDGDGTVSASYTQSAVSIPTYTREGYSLQGFSTNPTGTTGVTTPYVPPRNIDLYAIWQADSCTITYNPGAGSLATGESNTKTVNYDDPYGAFPTLAERPGYDFDKWVDPSNNEVKSTDLVKGSIELTAVWLGSEYTVYYDYGIGSGTETSKTVRNEGLYGELATPNAMTGYRFIGWYTTPSTGGSKITPTTQVNLTDNQTLYARYEEVNSKLTINLNGGKVGTSTDNIEDTQREGQTRTLPEPTHEPRAITLTVGSDVTIASNRIMQSRNFTGWSKTSGNGTVSTDNTTFTFGSEDTEIVAQYSYENVTLPMATKNGCTLEGWYTPGTSGTKVGEAGDNVAIGVSITELVPHWTTNKYTVTFVNDDDSPLYSTPVEHGSNATYSGEIPKAAVTRPGYKYDFDGWDNAADLDNVTGPVTVKATYIETPITYTINYVNTKGKTNTNPISYTVEGSNITLQNLEDNGEQQFLGWFTEAGESGTQVTVINTSEVKNVTLYAHWSHEKLYLHSDPYKIGLNDIDNYEAGDKYIDKIEADTTVREFINNLNTNGTVKVYDGDRLVSETELIGTGMTVKDTGFGEEFVLTAVVMGDTDGNGRNTATDLADIKHVILRTLTLEGPYFLAADQDDSGKITATDLASIKQVLLRVFKFTYTKPAKS